TGLRDEALAAFLSERPGAAVLFSNVLGQLPLLLSDEREQERFGEFWKMRLAVLTGDGARAWASFHDRFSGALEPRFTQALGAASRPGDAELVELCFAQGGRGELVDHDTDGFFPPEKPHAYFSWELTAGRWHLIEATRST